MEMTWKITFIKVEGRLVHLSQHNINMVYMWSEGETPHNLDSDGTEAFTGYFNAGTRFSPEVMRKIKKKQLDSRKENQTEEIYSY
jgi:hypothetical protein